MKMADNGQRIILLMIAVFLVVDPPRMSGSSSPALSSEELVQQAAEAFRNRQVLESKRLFEQLWKTQNTDLKDFTTAGRMLGYFEFHFFNNLDGVYPYYHEMIKQSQQKVDLYQRLADYEIRSRRFEEARQTLKKAQDEHLTAEQKKALGILWSKATLGHFVWENIDRLDREQLKKELSDIEKNADESPENTELAYLQMGFSLLLRDKNLFWEGWRNYFRLPEDKEARSFLAESQVHLARGLEAWERGAVTLNLIEGLVLSRLYDLAVMMLKFDASNLNQQPTIENIRHYYQYLHQTEDHGFSYYRDKALGNNDCDAYFAKQDKLDLWMWEKLMGKDGQKNYSRGNLESELYKRFGLKMMFTGRGESKDLIIFGGHGYIEETVQIEQYGRRGSFKYIKLHNLMGNIYDHWFQNYIGIGGWASTGGEVMQVRNWYLNYPVTVWNRLSDKDARKNLLNDINTQMEKDAKLLEEDPYAFPAGLAAYVKFLRYDQMIQSLRQKGLTGEALKMAFFSEVEFFFEYTGMHLHEARHVLDNPIYLANKEKYPLGVREFRAKLSEIAFSPDPHLAVAESILEEGTANRDVIVVIVNWMKENKSSIKNYDATEPLLLQLMNLTKDQLIEAVRRVDPFAQTSKQIEMMMRRSQ